MSKEMDRMREEQQVKKAAELKAKLDMVELRDKPRHGRAPKKIGEMICNTGVKVGYRESTTKFVLRLDDGDFIAEHGDFWYVSKSRDALQTKMDQVARVTLNLKWTRYLKVSYKAEIPYGTSWSDSTTTLEVDDERKKPILGMKLSWEVMEYSDVIQLPGVDGERYMSRKVDEDGEVSSQQTTVKELPVGLVPYSKEREAILNSIREAFTAIDKKMSTLFHGSPEQVAKQLDAVQGPLLLAAPAKGKRS